MANGSVKKRRQNLKPVDQELTTQMIILLHHGVYLMNDFIVSKFSRAPMVLQVEQQGRFIGVKC